MANPDNLVIDTLSFPTTVTSAEIRQYLCANETNKHFITTPFAQQDAGTDGQIETYDVNKTDY